MRLRREELMRDPRALLEVLRQGSLKAAERADATMRRVRLAMNLDYDALFAGGGD